MIRLARLFASLALVLAAAAPSFAQNATVPAPGLNEAERDTMPTLWVGDKAPPIAVSKWLKGDPSAGPEKGKISVIEFWATWCVPCIRSMPHLADVQAKYRDKGLTVISVTTESSKNTLSQIEAMVKEKSDTMAFTVAVDDGSKTYDAFMRTSRRSGIPCAFLINGEGTLAWIGHPMELAGAIGARRAGTLDMKAEAEAARDYFTRFIAARNANREYNAAKTARDWQAALKAARDLQATGLGDYAWSYGEELEILFIQIKDYDAAYQCAERLIAQEQVLNRIAWTITAFDGIGRRDLDVAERAARKATETEPDNPYSWRALGAVYFRRGDREHAIEAVQKGIGLAKYDWDREPLELALRWVKGEVPSPLAN